MPRPYSLDLREHVVPAVAYGLGCRVARGVYSGHHDGGALVATVASDRECRGVPDGPSALFAGRRHHEADDCSTLGEAPALLCRAA